MMSRHQFTFPILLPDLTSSTSLENVANVACSFRLPTEQSRLEKLRSELERDAPEFAIAQARAMVPFVACVFLRAVAAKIDLYVSAFASLHCHLINSAAILNPALRIHESIVQGRFVVAGLQLLNQSLEAKLEGRPLVVDPKKLLAALKRRPSSEKEIKECVKSVIGEADQNGLELTNDRIVAAAQERGVNASKSQILRIAKQHKPAAWRRPGPKKNRPAT
jgi:hypothetical protein